MSFQTICLTLTRRFLSLTLPPPVLSPRWSRFLLGIAVGLLGLALAWLPLKGIVLLMGGAGLLSLLLFKPVVGLYLLIPTIPFSPLLSISAGGFKVGGMEFLLALSLATWLLQLSTRPDPNSPHHFDPPGGEKSPFNNVVLWVPFLVLLAGVSLSWLNSLSIGASLVETAKWVEMLALYLLVIALVPARHILGVVLVMFLAGTAQAGLGLYQFVFKVGPPGFLLFGGLFLRAYGTFAQPNPYAGYLGLILPLALAITAWSLEPWLFGRPDSRRGWLLAAAGLTLGLLLVALFATQSRGAWLGFTIAALVTLAARSQKVAMALVALALVGAIAILAGSFESVAARIGAFSGPSLYSTVSQRLWDALAIMTIQDVSAVEVKDANFATIERLAHWQAAREMWRDAPWLGVGFGNYEVVYPAYAAGRWFNSLGHAHNYLLNIGAETGLVGFGAYLIFWGGAFRMVWLAIRRSAGFEQAVAAGGLGVLTHLHIHNLFDNLYVQGMYLHVAVILAIISIIYSTRYDTRINLAEENRVNQGKHL